MIKKPREIPLTIRKLEALLRRTDDKNEKRPLIQQDYTKRLAGYKGERSMNYHLSLLDSKKYHIFHDLRLKSNQYYFQIDILILTSNYFLILEIKNIIGSVLFESHFDQFIRSLNGKEEGFYNPLDQIKKQTYKLKMWLNENKVSNPPIESLVCFSNPQTIIRADSRIKAAQTVIHSHNLLSKIEKMDLKHGMPIFTEKELSKISRKLIKTHNEEDPNILERYNIKSEEILKGVQCPNCSEISMTRKRGMWVCSGCKTKSEKAHLTALEDFSLLLGHYITHQQCKDFLGLDSKSITSKIIESLELPHCGSKYKRTYTLQKL